MEDRPRSPALRRPVGAWKRNARGRSAGFIPDQCQWWPARQQVEIVEIDDRADPDTGVAAANSAIKSGLDGVVGPYNSGVGIKTLPIYIKAGLVPIRLTSDNETDGLGFTLQPMTDQIAPVAGKAISQWLGAKKAAIVYDRTEAYTRNVSKAVKGELDKAGVEVVAYESLDPGADDYAAEVRKLAGTGADVIYAAVYFPEGAKIAEEMLAQKVEARCLADYGSYDTGFVEDAGVKVARSCPVVGVPAPNDFGDSAKFVDEFRHEFESEPGTWSPYTYDSVNFLAEGVKGTNGFDADELNQIFSGFNAWTGWTGGVNIDPQTGNRDPATVVVTSVDKTGAFHVDSRWAAAVDAPY
ncbi:MAG: branched-chain amino acid ABC transporter substrate-binding protein [Thermoleophilia bacterium]|nr:branched-chain amino acid ABC transporter substrate-binding protein [Thermoleophilia bacterium]